MAATIAKVQTEDRTGRTKEASRLGSHRATAQANTWNTFTECSVLADGSGYIEVRRNGKTLHRFDFDAE